MTTTDDLLTYYNMTSKNKKNIWTRDEFYLETLMIFMNYANIYNNNLKIGFNTQDLTKIEAYFYPQGMVLSWTNLSLKNTETLTLALIAESKLRKICTFFSLPTGYWSQSLLVSMNSEYSIKVTVSVFISVFKKLDLFNFER